MKKCKKYNVLYGAKCAVWVQMHTVLCLGTNDNVRLFDYYVVN